jgi:hypothetical protein
LTVERITEVSEVRGFSIVRIADLGLEGMSDTNFIKRNPRRWLCVARSLMILGLLCFLYSGFSLNYSVFWTEAKARASSELSLAAISCWIAALIITARLGLFKLRR